MKDFKGSLPFEEILDVVSLYDRFYLRWNKQNSLVCQIKKEIVKLESDLRAEESYNASTVESDMRIAVLELENAKKEVMLLESDLSRTKISIKDYCCISDTNNSSGIINPDIETKSADNSENKHTIVELEKNLQDAFEKVKDCENFYNFVFSTYEEQKKIWNTFYESCRLRINSLVERLKGEEVKLNLYKLEMDNYFDLLQGMQKSKSGSPTVV